MSDFNLVALGSTRSLECFAQIAAKRRRAVVRYEKFEPSASTAGTPVLPVSLTPHNFQPPTEHQNVYFEHFEKKCREAAETTVDAAGQHRHLTVADRNAA